MNAANNSESKLSIETGPPTDRVFDAFAHRRRRDVLYCLRQYENPMALADLASEVAARENDTIVADVPGEEIQRVHTSLYHSHVPRLVDLGLVEYDQGRDVVALVEHANLGGIWSERLEELCDLTNER